MSAAYKTRSVTPHAQHDRGIPRTIFTVSSKIRQVPRLRQIGSGAVVHVDAIVAQGRGGIVPIVGMHHQAAGENADAALEDAHIYVHFKAVYTLALKQRLGKGDGGHITCAHQLFHHVGVRSDARFVERHGRWISQQEVSGVDRQSEQTA